MIAPLSIGTNERLQLIAEGSSKLASVRKISRSMDLQRLINLFRFLPEEEALLLPPLLVVEVLLLLLRKRRRRKSRRRFVTSSIIFPWVN